MKKLAWAVLAILLLTAAASTTHQLTVDGQTYQPTKITGTAVHYETPNSHPLKAASERNEWTGNGSEHLPCQNGIHWIDNKNLLTVSHCLPGDTTTTTAIVTTTTTEPNTTTTAPETTTSSSTTTTTPVESTTTSSVSSTTLATSMSTVPPTTTIPEIQTDLPETGASGLILIGLVGLLLTTLGAALVSNAKANSSTRL